MNAWAIECSELSRSFGPVQALDKLSLQVRAGSVFGFLGPNGAGKTTTIHLLLGLLEPTSGGAAVLGYNIRTEGDQIRLRTGALLQNAGLYDRLTAEDNLEFYGRIWRIPVTERRARIRELLEHVDLWDRRHDLVSTWSGGMRQKLGVIRTLLHRPALIFLDEPTAGLDPMAGATLRDDLAALSEHEGITVFLNTHNLAEAERLCHQVAVIRQGRLVATGAPEELRRRRSAPRLEITGSGFGETVLAALKSRPEVLAVTASENKLLIDVREGIDTAPLVSRVVASGASVQEVMRPRASLEDVFLTLMEGNDA